MTFREILPGLWGATRARMDLFALRDGDGFVLIDTGYPHFVPTVLEACSPLGPLKNIVVTPARPDHAGGLKGSIDRTGAVAWMHPEDAALVRRGRALRPYTPAPTPLGRLVTRLYVDRQSGNIPAVGGVRLATDGEHIPVAGGLEVYHLPGHSAGQIALGWNARDGQRVIFAAAACMNVVGLSEPLLYEDRPLGIQSLKQSLRRPADLARGADLMLAGHGQPLRNPGEHLSQSAEGLSSRKGHRNL